MQILDLHGYSLQEAWKTTLEHIDSCYEDRIKKTKIITGKGKIAEEFQNWTEMHPKVRKIEKTNDGGCFFVWTAIKQK